MVHHIQSQLHLHSCLIAKVSVHQAVPGTCAQTKSIDSIAACDCLVYHVHIAWLHRDLDYTLVVHMMLGVANHAGMAGYQMMATRTELVWRYTLSLSATKYMLFSVVLISKAKGLLMTSSAPLMDRHLLTCGNWACCARLRNSCAVIQLLCQNTTAVRLCSEHA